MREAVASFTEGGAEQEFLDRLVRLFPQDRDVEVGPGDDCAVLRVGTRRVLVTTDAMVEGVHFRAGWLTPKQLGSRAWLVAASDVAAMGGRPTACVVSVGVPEGFPARDLMAIHRGIRDAARSHGGSVAGGNVSRSPALFVSVTVLGEAPRRSLLRSGARPGDLLYVTGTLGDAALGVRRLSTDPRARGRPVRRYRNPEPRFAVGTWLTREVRASAAIDVSDGLVLDVYRLCRASGVGAVITAPAVPVSDEVRKADPILALTGGDDYELAFAVPPRRVRRLERWAGECRLSRIGWFVAGPPRVTVLDAEGRPMELDRPGFDHFRWER